ncbi:hypothetical protein, partial [Metallibacterium sp.]|uniref:hypothetical protein n=1 Tax=Metallibacterium sp. TaxID=2940281 RepID=UPI002627051E
FQIRQPLLPQHPLLRPTRHHHVRFRNPGASVQQPNRQTTGAVAARLPSTQVLVATKVARLCRARLLANRSRMPGFAN